MGPTAQGQQRSVCCRGQLHSKLQKPLLDPRQCPTAEGYLYRCCPTAKGVRFRCPQLEPNPVEAKSIRPPKQSPTAEGQLLSVLCKYTPEIKIGPTAESHKQPQCK